MKKGYLLLLLVFDLNTALFAQNQLTSEKSTWWLQESIFNPAASAARSNSDVTVLHDRSQEIIQTPKLQTSFIAANYRFKKSGLGIGVIYNSNLIYSSANSDLGFNLNYKFKFSENQDFIVGIGTQFVKEANINYQQSDFIELVPVGSKQVVNIGFFYRYKKFDISYGINNLFNSIVSPMSYNTFRHVVSASFEMILNDKMNFRPKLMYERVLNRNYFNAVGEFFIFDRFSLGCRFGDPGIVGFYGSVLLMEKLNIGLFQQVGSTGEQGIVMPNRSQIFLNYRFNRMRQ